MTRKVFFALPAYEGVIRVETHYALMAELFHLAVNGIDARMSEPERSTLINTARGVLLARFVADPRWADCSDLVFIDWDVSWPVGAVHRLLDHPVDIVAGVYPGRQDPIGFSMRELTGKERPVAVDGLLEVDGCPGGFLRVSRRAAEAMVAEYPNEAFYAPGLPNDTAWNLFGEYRLGRILLQDDYAFCARARDIGLSVFVDPDMSLKHTGPKTFEGKLADWLAERQRIAENGDA
jgi:hypothetical protein